MVIVLALLAGWAGHRHSQLITDTRVILDGVGAADRCLHAGVTWNCNAAGLGDVGYFPPLQYIPVFAMKKLGFEKLAAGAWLGGINGAAFVLMLALGWLVLARRRAPALGPLFAAACLTSGLLWYATATFGEALTAFLTVGFVAALLLRANALVVFAAAVAVGLTKETAAPFLAVLGLAALLARGRGGWRPALVAAGAGLVVATLIDAELNLFRYGHVWNDFYLSPTPGDTTTRTAVGASTPHPPIRLWPGIAGAMLVSPNAGIFWFWGPLLALFAAGAAGARRAGERMTRAAGALAVLLLLVIVAFFTTWYAPYGWQAWGPRLADPWLPALALVALAAAPQLPARMAQGLLATRARAAGLVAVLALFGLPQLGAYLDTHLPFDLFRDSCVNDTRHYYDCLSHLAWGAKPVLLRGYEALGHGGRPLIALAYVAVLGTLVGVARRHATAVSAIGSAP